MKMKVIGLTGSIGMGKSTAARQLRGMGYCVYDADWTIHKLMRKGGGAVKPLAAAYPDIPDLVSHGEVNRERLRQLTYEGKISIPELEEIFHPLEADYRTRWLEKKQREGRDMVFADIPLLFEKGYEGEMAAVLVVSASAETQRQRVLSRKGMTAPRLKKILDHQLSDAEKRSRADFVIYTGDGMERSRDDLRAAIAAINAPGFAKKSNIGYKESIMQEASSSPHPVSSSVPPSSRPAQSKARYAQPS